MGGLTTHVSFHEKNCRLAGIKFEHLEHIKLIPWGLWKQKKLRGSML